MKKSKKSKKPKAPPEPVEYANYWFNVWLVLGPLTLHFFHEKGKR